ncbi:RNA 2',3'-cyclic phosphodiesterase [Alkalihalobacterium elongatum]|uniref:RNA 2',3'-cyclic phosphodiesterase n=1 Tax=Alkalihalobacterium elongatum TaxID=2675466 RepID=UPI001C1F7BEE|nr:RNA 2',3'-cyclic phosphodiesterase [Alkalihalobacterium elongatum]
MKAHFFLAIPVLGSANQSLVNWKEEHSSHFPFQKWIHPQDLHITLVFLGHVEKAQLIALGEQIDKTIKNYHSFTITLNELNTFGDLNRPRIFWAGVEKPEQLMKLQMDIAQTCVNVGLDIEKRPYRPHITLARRWKANGMYTPALANELFTAEYQRSWEVEKIHLYQSHPGKSPMYEPIQTFFLSTNV